MLKLRNNVGEWGFVVVLAILFAGLAVAIIYSQAHLHDMRVEQAYADTESNLHVLAEQVRNYQRDQGRVEDTLTRMGVSQDSLHTRHANFEDNVRMVDGLCTIEATLGEFGRPTCTLHFALDSKVCEYRWNE